MSKHNYTLSNMSKHTSENIQDDAMTERLIPTAEKEFDKLEQHLGCDLSGLCDVPAGGFTERERERNTNRFHTGTLFSLQIINSILDHNSF